jgi:glycosyltransferase involved in cell wall biosynthesis
MLRYSVIIPCWNEETALPNAVEETSRAFSALGEPFEILVVDDGSTDRTAETAYRLASQDPHVRVIALPTNRGKGAAVREGVRASEGDWILFLDADLATPPQTMERVKPCLDRCDLVQGSRRITGARIEASQPVHRVWLGRVFNVCVRALFRLPYRDTQCGFKAFHRRLRPILLGMETDGWAFDVELLLAARKVGARIEEVPVTWRHGRVSRVRLRQVGRILVDLWRLKRRYRA